MKSDKKIKEITLEAEKLKKSEEEKLRKNAPKTEKKKEIHKTPSHDETWRVYRALFGRGVEFLWLLPVVLAPIPFIMFINEPKKLWMSLLTLAAIPLLRWGYLKLQLYRGYAKFRDWRKNLPFRLAGWEAVVDTEHFHSMLYWRLEASLEIEFESQGEFTEKVLEDMLFLFCKNANKSFYTPEFAITGFAGDPRAEWKADTHIAKGSLNNEVVFWMHKFLSEELAPLALKYQNIRTVILKASPKEYKIDPKRVSSD